MIQIVGIKRQVFIKFVDKEEVHALLRDTTGRAEYKYPNGEIFIVNILVDMAGMVTKRIRVANVSPEVHKDTLHESLASFGKVLNIHAETWAKIYRYPVSNGVRQVVMHLTRHLPSHLTIAGYIGCPRRNVKYFGRVFLMLNYTDITQNTYIQS